MKRAITYSKAALLLERLRAAMGERAFWAALATYTRTFAGRAVTSEDFERVFSAATDVDLNPLYNRWVDGP
jgi:aminopeptidase N